MKKVRFVGVLLGLIVVQGAHSQSITAEAANKIMSKSGCITCHAMDKDKIGPAYNLVAQRYASPSPEVLAYLKGEKPAEYLFKKVRSGTKPKLNKNWVKSSSGKPYGLMTPNSASKISDQDLKSLIEYILALKK